jgi:hypothetical protein
MCKHHGPPRTPTSHTRVASVSFPCIRGSERTARGEAVSSEDDAARGDERVWRTRAQQGRSGRAVRGRHEAADPRRRGVRKDRGRAVQDLLRLRLRHPPSVNKPSFVLIKLLVS